MDAECRAAYRREVSKDVVAVIGEALSRYRELLGECPGDDEAELFELGAD